MKSIKLCLVSWFMMSVISASLWAGDQVREVPFSDTAPIIDGKLDDAVWANALRFENFKTYQPDYGRDLSQKTIGYITFDKNNLYFAAECFDTDVSKIKGAITKHDNINSDDWVSLILDTFNDRQSAVTLQINPLGMQGDGVLDRDGNLNSDPDYIWFSKGVINDKGYCVEAKLPLKSIRYAAGKKVTMGIAIIRNISRTSERGMAPEFFPDKGTLVSQTERITFSDLKYKRVIELLPALTYSMKHHNVEGDMKSESKDTDFGLTGKLGITPKLTLDLTYNPDFSQVESDVGQVDVNLRYALYHSEKRPFFLEGANIFDLAGNTEEAPLNKLLHTRNIIDPIFGLKLSGKISRRTDISTLVAIDEAPAKETDNSGNFLHPDKNATFAIFRLRHALKDDSFIGGVYSGREFLDGYNRIIGTDGRLRLSGTSLTEFHLLKSFSRTLDGIDKTGGHAAAIRYQYNARSFVLDTGVQDISRDFQADTGYLTRTNLTRLGFMAIYRIYPKSNFFQCVEPFYWSYHIYDKESEKVETTNLLCFRVNMANSASFRLDWFLGNEIFAKQRFNRNAIGIQYYTQITKKLNLSLYLRRSNAIFYDAPVPFQGKSFRFETDLLIQPYEKLDIMLSGLYTSFYSDFYSKSSSEKIFDYTLLRSRTTFQLNKYLFLRNIMEYNFYKKTLQMDFLASFTYIPGTVVFFGYGSLLEKSQWDPTSREYLYSSKLHEMRRSLFFKISYLWRL